MPMNASIMGAKIGTAPQMLWCCARKGLIGNNCKLRARGFFCLRNQFHLCTCVCVQNATCTRRNERGGRTNEIDFCTLVCVCVCVECVFFEETLSSTARALKLLEPRELGKHSGEPHLICCKFVLRRDSHANFTAPHGPELCS
jgi:hypothetical protein